MLFANKLNFRSSVIPLIVVNLYPLYGVISLGWDIRTLLILYWAESAVIGFYNIFKIVLAKSQYDNGTFFNILEGYPVAAFFILHFGGFMLIHFMGLLMLTSYFENITSIILLDVFNEFKFALLLFMLSHGYSFFVNFILGGEYKFTNKDVYFGQPYTRILLMHVVIMAGTVLSFYFGNLVGFLLILILLKTYFDFASHLKEHPTKSDNQPTVEIQLDNSNRSFLNKLGIVLGLIPAISLTFGLVFIVKYINQFGSQILNDPISFDTKDRKNEKSIEEFDSYVNTTYNLDIKYPKSWTVTDSLDTTFQQGAKTYLHVIGSNKENLSGFSLYVTEGKVCSKDNLIDILDIKKVEFLGRAAFLYKFQSQGITYDDYYVLSDRYCYVYTLDYKTASERIEIERILSN
ncbi:hypothetical protein CO058_03085 [candidate division WWE3 bacterium CG_4_9_14_0_2_um_filter_35_11]|uniref:Uncharacterized protein n=1 Tax=candidate division WWE3 bacterium CG_4_9_14_0_2_um_filter_35_11 TaxID=1975077 RepID=A0A2M8EL97_UNCKA|nr:MAG: hypothetical protein COV25_01490 [candidate division WWE3 bacterium CG10_big_fil_rev_8_21_14_0_10_35_32]PJC23514.1 MAG: hypothetical protein CO058_03085 [candidate division WWE3 bacterium CG_4_9_14_0_2_um_filter_35_11]